MIARQLVVVIAVSAAIGGCVSAGSASASAKPPVLHAQTLTVPDPQASEEFGSSVAVSGDLVVVGAYGQADSDVGAAYVYQRSAAGWSHVRLIATLEPSEGASGEEFGSGVAISGGTIVVSAPDQMVGSNSGQGAVYVFTEPRSGWSGTVNQSETLTASDGGVNDELGENGVAISGDTVVAGAGNHKVGSNNFEGAAYVWSEPIGGWQGTHSQSEELMNSDGAADDSFGFGEVGISGNTVVVAAGAHDQERGALYVFLRPAAGWSGIRHESAELTPTDVQIGDSFGYESVAISGNTIVGGSGEHSVGAVSEQGEAYVFVRPKSGWSGMLHQNAELVASDGTTDDRLAEYGVVVSGRSVVTAAPYRAVDGVAAAGAVYDFTEPAHGWSGRVTQTSESVAPDGATNDLLGDNSIALDGTTIAAGSTAHAPSGATGEGAAYVFAPSRPTLAALKESKKSWRATTRRAVLNPAHKPKKGGTRFSFSLAQAGMVTVRFVRHGHKKAVGGLTVTAPQGKSALYFYGRLASRKKFAPGRYAAAFSTANSAGISTRHVERFTVTKH